MKVQLEAVDELTRRLHAEGLFVRSRGVDLGSAESGMVHLIR